MPLPGRRFDTRIGVRPIKAMDALRNIVHGHTGRRHPGESWRRDGQNARQTVWRRYPHPCPRHYRPRQSRLHPRRLGERSRRSSGRRHRPYHDARRSRQSAGSRTRHQRIFHVLGHIERRKHAILAKAGLLKGKVALGLCDLARDRNKRSRVVERGTIER